MTPPTACPQSDHAVDVVADSAAELHMSATAR